MLTVEQLSALEGFLLSDRVTLKGNEFMALGQLIAAIQTEKSLQLVAQRTAPAPQKVE